MNIKELYEKFLICEQNVSTDTRDIKQGSMFFAWKGEHDDGNKFAKKALELGAKFAVIDNSDYIDDEKYILVDDSIKTLQDLANYHRKQFDIPVVAITGSNGKTTTKELLTSILKTEKNIISSEGNLNNHVGVPKTILKITNETEIAIIEMGANHIGEIALLCEIAMPTSGIITNIGRAHLGLFGGFDGVVRAKTELYRYLEKTNGASFINGTDDLLLSKSNTNTKITYLSDNSDYPVVSEKTLPFISLNWKNNNIKTNLTGEYNIDNIVAAISISEYFGISDKNIVYGIENYKPQNARSEIIETKNGNMIIKDYYNANRTSMECAIDNLVGIKTDKTKIVILGDMFDLGDFSLDEHRAVLGYVIKSQIENIVLVGADFFKISDEYIKTIRYKTTQEAIAELKKQEFKDSVILLKASQGMKFRNIFEFIDW